MGDEDGLIPRIAGELVKLLRQGLDGGRPAPDLAVHHDMTVLVALEQGLDAQHGAQQGLGPGDAPAAADVEQVVYGKVVGDVGAQGKDGVGRLVQAHALLPQRKGPQDQEALP